MFTAINHTDKKLLQYLQLQQVRRIIYRTCNKILFHQYSSYTFITKYSKEKINIKQYNMTWITKISEVFEILADIFSDSCVKKTLLETY